MSLHGLRYKTGPVYLFTLVTLVAITVSSAHGYTPDPWERRVSAACLVLEASGEGTIGLMAVANVISNRAGGDPRRFYKVVKNRRTWIRSHGNEGVSESELERVAHRGRAPLFGDFERFDQWRHPLLPQARRGLLDERHEGDCHHRKPQIHAQRVRKPHRVIAIMHATGSLR